MKWKLSLSLLFCLSIWRTGIAQKDFKQHFFEITIEKWHHNREYVIKMIELMPEDKFDYRVTPETATFRKQVLHMIQNMVWLSTKYLHAPAFDHDIKYADPNKEELLTLLNLAFDTAIDGIAGAQNRELSETVDFFAGEKSLLQIIELMDDHLTHHKGQLVAYLRLCDQVPPSFVGW